jgi:hypothetical protein
MSLCNWVSILPNCKETTTNSIKLRFDESSRTSLTGLNIFLRNEMFIFNLNWPSGASLLAHLQLKCILYVPL